MTLAPDARPPAPAADEADKLKILVVDDTATNRQILQVFLRKLGFAVDIAVDGEKAIERFVAGSPDLVLMDVMMPVMDGFEATRRIKALCGDRWVPVVFLSALDKEENLVMGLDAGGDDYLHKPVNFVVLDAKLRSLKRSIMLQRALDENRRRMQAISDNIVDGLVTADEQGIVLSANAAAVKIFGYAAEELLGQNVSRLMPEPHRSAHDGYLRRYIAGGEPHIIGRTGRTVEGLRKNGEVFPLDLSVTELSFEGRRLFVGFLRDVTEEHAAQQLLRENAERLQRYHDTQEEENSLAQRIMEQQMGRPGLADPRLRHWIASATSFSGDVIAAARSPEGWLYVMLADATGHGLSAAISVLPVLTMFYYHVELGYPLGYIVSELNRNLRATMPPGRFVAASLLCFSEESGSVQLWQGGMPDVLLLGADGAIKSRFAAQHVPLGIVDYDKAMTEVAEFALGQGDQLVMFSDGLIEAADGRGAQFGHGRLEEVLRKAPPSGRLDAVRTALHAHSGIGDFHDDVSLLLIGGP